MNEIKTIEVDRAIHQLSTAIQFHAYQFNFYAGQLMQLGYKTFIGPDGVIKIEENKDVPTDCEGKEDPKENSIPLQKEDGKQQEG